MNDVERVNLTAEPSTSVSLLGRLRRSPIDGVAWSEFVTRYGPVIFGWCRQQGLQDADAQDITQAVLLKLLRVMQSFAYDPGQRFRAWLRTMTQNAWLDLMRARRHAPPAGAVDLKTFDKLESSEDLAAEMEAAFEQELVQLALPRVRLRVHPATWDAFRLTVMEGKSGTAVAALLHMSVAAVYKARSNVQKMLRDEVEYLEGADS